jgi:carboxylate-amine ligase
LTIEHAALLGCYAQLLARWLLTERPLEIDDKFYLLYQYNRFEASRYGLEGQIALHRSDSTSAASKQPIFTSVLDRLQDLERYTENEAEVLALKRLRQIAYERVNDATWLRQKYKQRGSLNDVTRLASELWMSHTSSPDFQ